MTLSTVDIFHDKQADASLDGSAPSNAIKAGDYNGAHKVDLATLATALPVVTSSAKGVAPASGGGTTNFLRADGTWAAPAGGGGGGTDGFFQTFGVGPFIVPPDIGPGVIDNYNPWTAAGASTGDHAVIVLNPSINGVTINGIVSTGRTNDFVVIQVGGDGKGVVTIGHMASATAANRIYCPSNSNIQIANGGTLVLHCLNQGDHAYRVVAAFTGMHHNAGSSMDVTLTSTPVDNWAPTGGVTNRWWKVTTNIAGSTVTGINAMPDGLNPYKSGDIITLQNMGDGINSASATLTLRNYNSSSLGANRFVVPGFVGVDNPAIVVPLYGVVQLMRDRAFDSGTGAWFLLGKW